MNIYYKILNEIASVFDVDQWDEQVDPFTDVINRQLNAFVHNTEYDNIYILEYSAWGCGHDFPQYNFYRDRCYVNGEKVELIRGTTKNKWKDQKTVNVTIEDLDQLGKSCKCMFNRCESLVSVPLFDTSNVAYISSMFYACNSLVSVPLFDTSNILGMDDMFAYCKSLSEETKQAWSSVYNFKTDRMI